MSKNTFFSLIATVALITGTVLPACGGGNGGGSDGNGPFGEGEAEGEAEAEAEAEGEELYARLQGTFTYPETGLVFDFNYSNDPAECPACEPCKPGHKFGCAPWCKAGEEVVCVSPQPGLVTPPNPDDPLTFSGRDRTGGSAKSGGQFQFVWVDSDCQGEYTGPGSYGVGLAHIQVALPTPKDCGEDYESCSCPREGKPGKPVGTLEVFEEDRAVRVVFHVEHLARPLGCNYCSGGMDGPATGVLEGEILIPR